jgi:predicted RNase H-like HicB family nuclease
MIINLNVLQSQPSANLKVTLLVETLKNGQFVASIFEFPNFRVEAQTREEAISQLQTTFLEGLTHIEAISWNVPLDASPPTWMQFAGVFQDDPDFQEIMDEIRAERTSDDDTEVDSSYYL